MVSLGGQRVRRLWHDPPIRRVLIRRVLLGKEGGCLSASRSSSMFHPASASDRLLPKVAGAGAAMR